MVIGDQNLDHGVSQLRAAGLRNPDPHCRALSRGASDGQIASEQHGPLSHSQDSERPAFREFILGDPLLNPRVASAEESRFISWTVGELASLL